MSDDHGEAIRTGQLVGDAAEQIVVVDSTSVEKHLRPPYDWGGAFAAVEGPW